MRSSGDSAVVHDKNREPYERLARERLHNERLLNARFSKPEDVVGWLCAVQAQDYAGAKWAIGQRLPGSTDDDVEQAFERGRILRTHVLRPTWHFVLPADIRWLLELTAPRIRAAMAYHDRKLGIDRALVRRSNAALAKSLTGGAYRTREELARVLAKVGIQASGQKLGHLLMRAELDQVVCSGPRRKNSFTYALLAERAPPSARKARDQALAELARRYFASHGPALVQDLAWWAGLTVADAKRGVSAAGRAVRERVIDGKSYFSGRSAAPRHSKGPAVHLLPNYDEFLISYRDYRPVIDETLVQRLGPRDGLLSNHIVVVNGQALGAWRRTFEKKGVTVEVKLLARLGRAEERALRAQAEHFGRFLRLPVRLSLTGYLPPLAARPL